MEINEVELTETATELRTLFAKRKRRSIPKYRMSERDRRLDNWKRVAKACHAMNADPRDWVEASFMYNTVCGGPFVTALHGPKSREWYSLYIKDNSHGESVGSIKARVKFDFSILANCIERNNNKPESEQKSLAELILDPFNRISPYVAVATVVAEKEALEEESPGSYEKIISKYLDDARALVRGSVAYLDAIDESIKGGVDLSILN